MMFLPGPTKMAEARTRAHRAAFGRRHVCRGCGKVMRIQDLGNHQSGCMKKNGVVDKFSRTR